MEMRHDYWPSGVPRGAQQMLCSDFSATCRQKLRDRDHGEREWTIFRCPSCGRAAEQEHGVQSSCCDLIWVGYGNGLYVWGVDGEPVARNLNPLFINGVQQFRGMPPDTPDRVPDVAPAMTDNERAVIDAAVEWQRVRDLFSKRSGWDADHALTEAINELHNEHDGRWEPSE